MRVIFFLSPLLFFPISISIDTKVQLSTGNIEGRVFKTPFNNSAYIFLGIPYAEPPVGDLRFANPEPKNPWQGTISCKEFRPTCLFNTTKKSMNIPQSEDCLFVNVFVGPRCSEENLCAVIFYIGGGGFNFGTPATYYPIEFPVNYYATQDIIFVTSTFRSGALAFWYTGTEEGMGDYVFFDLLQGLHWVQQEISNFGGDKNRVTIMGYSSGGITVSLLTLSPVTEGLFHQAIPMSGAANELPTAVVSLSKQMAILAGCADEQMWDNGQKYKEIVACMRKVDANEIVRLQKVIEPMPLFAGPVKDERLWPDSISNLRRKRRPIPMLLGSTINEYGTDKKKVPVGANSSFLIQKCKLAAVWLGHPLKYNQLIGDKCVEHYAQVFGSSDIPNAYSNLTSDYQVYVPVWTEAKSMREKAPVYLYQFEYRKPGFPDFPTHAQDLAYSLGTHQFYEFDENDYKIIKINTGLIGNFVKTGVPSPEFKTLTNPGFNYYSIDLKTDNKDFYHFTSGNFWTEIIPNLVKGAEEADTKVEDKTVSNSNIEPSTNWKMGFWILFGLVMATVAIFVIMCALSCVRKTE